MNTPKLNIKGPLDIHRCAINSPHKGPVMRIVLHNITPACIHPVTHLLALRCALRVSLPFFAFCLYDVNHIDPSNAGPEQPPPLDALATNNTRIVLPTTASMII